VFVLILNWNGWQDTIPCLESVFCNEYPDFRVVVCDNDSADDSLGQIKRWAEGALQPSASAFAGLRGVPTSPAPKPIPYQELAASEVAKGAATSGPDVPLILIRTGGNLGFAGGNNVGLRYALSQPECAYVWLLNNDTVIERSALSAMVAAIDGQPHVGICGSTLRYFHAPDTVQALGGASYNKWTGLSKEIGNAQAWLGFPAAPEIERAMSYVSGASMLVTRRFLLEVGLMSEDYFLYFEELDWALRARGKFSLAYAPDSIVYHKEGASIGSGKSAKRSLVAEFYALNSRLKLTRKFFAWALPTVVAVAWSQAFKRLMSAEWSRARLMAGVLLGLRRIPPSGK
jgi:GT2 family glycosyltransferase